MASNSLKTLQMLPEEIIIFIANYLKGQDVVRLSHVCQRFFYILQNDYLWTKIMIRQKIARDPDIAYYAKLLANSVKTKCDAYYAREKLTYLTHISVRGNWSTCDYKKYALKLSEKSRIGHDERNLVIIDPVNGKNKWKIGVFDLRGHGFSAHQRAKVLELNLHDANVFSLDLKAGKNIFSLESENSAICIEIANFCGKKFVKAPYNVIL